jgi:uncharacterized protein YfaS (alpha-2-macroglobulin family)
LTTARDCDTSFNPRPVYEPGDTRTAAALDARSRGFNPRPVYEPGDTRNLSGFTTYHVLFQSAPGL